MNRSVLRRVLVPVLVAGALIGVSAPDAFATAERCDYAGSGHHFATCLNVVGQGVHVGGIGPGVVLDPGESKYGHHEVWGDQGARLHINTPARSWVNPRRWRATEVWGEGIPINRNFPDGSRICSSFWEHAPGGPVRRGIACVTVVR